MNKSSKIHVLILLAGCCWSCVQKDKPGVVPPLFTLMPASHTQVEFSNPLHYDREFNIYRYRNFYNGGGVAIGDINRDSLPDLYFTANMAPNKLYLNKGNFVFEDITESAGVGGTKAWSTGVAMADVNGDGWLDIYVCNSGDIKGDNKENELFINQGDNTFIEMAEAYGLNDRGYSTHAAFFDYDKDGDLDMYLLNNSYQAIGSFNLRNNIREERDTLGGDKLFRNDGKKFTDVSDEAGIYGSLIGFGLGVTVGDINQDGWQDIYVSNDFFERDYLYINQKNGTFTEELTRQMPSISAASMGADMADINGDAYPEIFVTDMLPSTEKRLKTKTTFEDWNKYQYNVKNGYYHQFIRNMLHLNHGDGSFSDIGRLAGVHATDWSWGALIFDMDLDGRKDIFVANGIYQDLTDQDYLSFVSDENTVRNIVKDDRVDYKQLIDSIPSEAIPNHAFHQGEGLQFSDSAAAWGLATPSFSNGAAYGDLDLDGDPDLVVNNVNMPCFIYRNESTSRLGHHYLKIILKGKGGNTYAFGSQIKVYAGAKLQYLEYMPIRGFESSMEPVALFGLGKAESVDSLVIVFPDQSIIRISPVKADQTLFLDQREAIPAQTFAAKPASKSLFEPLTVKGVSFMHSENDYSDFDRERLVYHMTSSEGPKVSIGDLNGDQLQDFFIGNAINAFGAIYLQQRDGSFSHTNQPAMEGHRASEDTGSGLFDADGDGDLDLYVCSGGSEYSEASSDLMDRLYLNDGKGQFTWTRQPLPTFRFESSSCVRPCDVDGDGDEDLFVGIRAKPFNYGLPVNGYLLINDGKGSYTDETKTRAPRLLQLGMITDARWADLDGDSVKELIVCGEYMPLQIFKNTGGQWALVQAAGPTGWWRCLLDVDIDGDGDMDLVAGNHGLNSRFKTQPGHPLKMYVNDFDQNGTVEQIITTFREGRDYPFTLKHDLLAQMPVLKKKYLHYSDFAGKTLDDFFSPAQRANTWVDSVTTLETTLFINDGKGRFSSKALPVEAQFSPVYALFSDDFNGDGKKDLILGGNLYRTKPETGRYDASYGLVLTQTENQEFRALPATESGICIRGEIRDIQAIRIQGKKALIIARNHDRPLFYTYR
ncbi:MAG TPA: VCBS repeat-containing protein [Saprospiraceae bacterium]|nr:VCBS repeat-containing protein [Saprospiraceae bacterium]HNT21702.1 VCBS repeat-containing protein [Saprospiraceae bacterium]